MGFGFQIWTSKSLRARLLGSFAAMGLPGADGPSFLGRVPLAVTAQLSTTLSARDLIALRPGDVVTLGRSSGQPVTVSVGELGRSS